MKKTPFIISLICALSFLFSITALAQTSPLGETKISFEQAIEIATNKVGGGSINEIEWKRKYQMFIYEIEIYNDGIKHEVNIDAVTGEIIKFKSKWSKYPKLSNDFSATHVTSNRAIEFAKIALSNAGGGTITKIEWERKYGQLVCEIEIRNNWRKHKVTIDAETSKIIRVKSGD